MNAIDPIQYDYRATLIDQTGLREADLDGLSERLLAAREEVLADVALWRSGGAVPAEKQPLDAGFYEWPERLLVEYRAQRDDSQLGRILTTARRLADEVDRLVVLGIGGSYMGARALFEACCQPFHNELSRTERGGRPRIYFDGNNVDNDATAGLLELLESSSFDSPEERWAIEVISKSGGTLETAAAFRIFQRALGKACGGDAEQLARLIVPVTGETGRLRELSQALGCSDTFPIPDGIGGRFSIFTAVGLLPAATLGLDIVRLLEGAATMNRRFQDERLGSNPVLDYVAVCHLLEEQQGLTIRVMSTWGKGLEAVGLWYDQLLSESLGKQQRGATPLSVVNTRDLHSRGQQHQEGRRDKLITNIIVGQPRRDPVAIGRMQHDQDELNALADKTLPDVLQAAIAGTNQAYAEDGRPTADLRLPRLDEASLGQLFQMLMLATVVEGRLVGTNPYGQPGVEAYKKHMNSFLRGK